MTAMREIGSGEARSNQNELFAPMKLSETKSSQQRGGGESQDKGRDAWGVEEHQEECCVTGFSWRELSKPLYAPDREPPADGSSNATKAQLGEAMVFAGLTYTSVRMVKGYLQKEMSQRQLRH